MVGAATVHRVLRGWLAQLGQTAYDDAELSAPDGDRSSHRG